MEFDVKLTAKDMFRFNLYHTYSHFNGWFSVLLAIMSFVGAYVTLGRVTTLYTLGYIFVGFFLLIYVPINLYFGSKRKIERVKEFQKPLHYRIDEEGVTVSQDGESSTLPWNQIYKITSTKNNVLIYSNRLNAYVVTKEALGMNYERLRVLAEKYLEKYRIRMK